MTADWVAMVFTDLEREWNRRKRGQRKERIVLAIAIGVGLVVAGLAYGYFSRGG